MCTYAGWVQQTLAFLRLETSSRRTLIASNSSPFLAFSLCERLALIVASSSSRLLPALPTPQAGGSHESRQRRGQEEKVLRGDVEQRQGRGRRCGSQGRSSCSR